VTSDRADSETVLSGGRFAQPVRRGDEVHRIAGRGAGNVHALLGHFATRGCPLTPRVRGTSADSSHEVLGWLPGTAAVPPMTGPVRSEQALASVSRAIRTIHDAAAGFTPPPGGTWQTDTLAVPDPAELIGHRDLGSWNILFDGPEVVGIIDWDLAGPTTRAFDLAIAAHSFVPLHPTRDLPAWGWPTEPDRAARLAAFAAAYGPEVTAAQLLDALLVHLTATAGYQAARIRDHDPAWAVHAEEDHPAGYRAAAGYLIDQYDTLTA